MDVSRCSASAAPPSSGGGAPFLTVGQVQAMFTAITRQHQALGTPVLVATLTRTRVMAYAQGRPV